MMSRLVLLEVSRVVAGVIDVVSRLFLDISSLHRNASDCQGWCSVHIFKIPFDNLELATLIAAPLWFEHTHSRVECGVGPFVLEDLLQMKSSL